MATVVRRPGRRNLYLVWWQDGRQVWRALGHDDQALAEQEAREVEAVLGARSSEERLRRILEVAGARRVPERRVPVGALWRLYEEQPRPRRITDRTLRAKGNLVAAWLAWMTARHPEVRYLAEVTEAMAAEYVASSGMQAPG